MKSIRSKLVHPKDPIDRLDKASVVYKIKYDKCKEAYVGETGHKLKDRFLEHYPSSSPVGQHMTERCHSICNESTTIMHSESNCFRRGKVVTIYVREDTRIRFYFGVTTGSTVVCLYFPSIGARRCYFQNCLLSRNLDIKIERKWPPVLSSILKP